MKLGVGLMNLIMLVLYYNDDDRGKRCEATAQSALGWYRPSVVVSQRRSAGTVVVVYFV